MSNEKDNHQFYSVRRKGDICKCPACDLLVQVEDQDVFSVEHILLAYPRTVVRVSDVAGTVCRCGMKFVTTEVAQKIADRAIIQFVTERDAANAANARAQAEAAAKDAGGQEPKTEKAAPEGETFDAYVIDIEKLSELEAAENRFEDLLTLKVANAFTARPGVEADTEDLDSFICLVLEDRAKRRKERRKALHAELASEIMDDMKRVWSARTDETIENVLKSFWQSPLGKAIASPSPSLDGECAAKLRAFEETARKLDQLTRS